MSEIEVVFGEPQPILGVRVELSPYELCALRSILTAAREHVPAGDAGHYPALKEKFWNASQAIDKAYKQGHAIAFERPADAA